MMAGRIEGVDELIPASVVAPMDQATAATEAALLKECEEEDLGHPSKAPCMH